MQEDMILQLVGGLSLLLLVLLITAGIRLYLHRRRNRPIILPKRPTMPNSRLSLAIDIDRSELTLPTEVATGEAYYLVIDTETFDPIVSSDERPGDYRYSPPIVLSWQTLDKAGNRLSEESYVLHQAQEERTISLEGTAIHGISNEMMLSGEEPNKVYERLKVVLRSTTCIVGHNLAFHLAILEEDLRLKGKSDLIADLRTKDQICTMLWGQSLGFKRWRGGEALYPRVDELFGHLYFGRMHLPIEYRSKSLRDIRLCAACLRCKLNAR